MISALNRQDSRVYFGIRCNSVVFETDSNIFIAKYKFGASNSRINTYEGGHNFSCCRPLCKMLHKQFHNRMRCWAFTGLDVFPTYSLRELQLGS